MHNNAHSQEMIHCNGLVIIDETNGPSPLPPVAVTRQPRKVADFVVPFPPEITPEQLIKERKNGTIPTKAMNKFFVYRRWCVTQLKLQGHQYPMTDVSGIISQHWQSEPATVKTYYENLAKEATKLYKKLYPVPPKTENKTARKERRKKLQPYQLPTPMSSPTATNDNDQSQAHENDYNQEQALPAPTQQQQDVLSFPQDDLQLFQDMLMYAPFVPMQATPVASPLVSVIPSNLGFPDFSYTTTTTTTTTPTQVPIDGLVYAEYETDLAHAIPSPSDAGSSSGFTTPIMPSAVYDHLGIDLNSMYSGPW